MNKIKPFYPMVSACLIAYKRPENIKIIVQHLLGFEFVGEILIWNNNPEVTYQFKSKKVKLINSEENQICYGRFLCTKSATNEIIYVQDDDVLVHNIEHLYQEFISDKTRITHALAHTHFEKRKIYNHFFGKEALLGWGAFFKKSWTFVLDEFLEVNAKNYLFKREADKIFTLLQHNAHNTQKAQIEILDGNSCPDTALYREPHHELLKSQAINRVLAYKRKKKDPTIPVTWNVVIPCRNYGHYLGETIHSVMLNSADYVITIVDDASTDNTEEVALHYTEKYPFITYVKLQENKGVSHARNVGAAAYESQFVVFLDADDMIGETYLFNAEKILRSGYDIANPDAIHFGNSISRWDVPEEITLDMMLDKNYIHTSAAFRRSYWLEVGGVDEKMENWQDYDFWIRLVQAGAKVKKIHGDHFYYRKHGHSKSTDSRKRKEDIRSYLRAKHSDLYESLLTS